MFPANKTASWDASGAAWRGGWVVVMCVLGIAWVTGCRSVRPPPPPVASGVVYMGPLLTTPQVIRGLQDRYSPVRTVWSRHDFAVSFEDKRGRIRTFDGDGVLLLRKPALQSPPGTPTEIRLTGTKDIAGTLFELGANRDRAWLTLHHDIDTMYWLPQGTEPVDPTQVPIRPDLVAEVLGVSDWVTDLSRYPTPVMTYQPESDTYRLTLVEPAPPNQGVFLRTGREVSVDRSTLMVRQIVFYGAEGRPTVVAKLDKWVGLRGSPGAFVPSDIVLSFPVSKATMRFSLREPVVSRNNLPSDISFRFPANPPVSKEIRLDQP